MDPPSKLSKTVMIPKALIWNHFHLMVESTIFVYAKIKLFYLRSQRAREGPNVQLLICGSRSTVAAKCSVERLGRV